MQTDRFRRTKAVTASAAIALVVAAVIVGLSSLVIGPRSAAPEHAGFEVASNASSFTIASNVYASPACGGSVATLSPGIVRCMVFTVHNTLTVPITVQSITSALDTTNYPAPPVGCSVSSLTTPTFAGSLAVAGGGTATTAGVPIELHDSGTNQNACENYEYHFLYSGTAQYTDSTSAQLSASPSPSSSGQSVTFKATVTAANPSTDASLPSGTVSFYRCATATSCVSAAANLLGSGSLGAGGVATYVTTSLASGTTYVEAVYAASGTDFLSSTSNVVSQVVTPTTIATTSSLTSSPNPSTSGTSVTFTDTVSSGSGTPSGSVTFYSCTTSACGTRTSLSTGTLSSGKVTFSTSTLPVGTAYVEAVYAGSGNYLTSTSNVVSQVVSVSVPSFCAPNSYNPIVGSPWFPVIYGTNRSDFIDAFGGSYWINGLGGNDCIDAGDGNNVIFDAGGNDVVVAGNGHNAVILGDGNNKVTLGNGSNGVETGNGNDTITLGNGWGSGVFVGDGADIVTVGGGSYNHVALGHGTDSVTIQNGSHDEVAGGNGNEIIFLGAGTGNSYAGQPHRTNTCHLPKPPSSWHGSAAAYYHDTITNCTVVTP